MKPLYNIQLHDFPKKKVILKYLKKNAGNAKYSPFCLVKSGNMDDPFTPWEIVPPIDISIIVE